MLCNKVRGARLSKIGSTFSYRWRGLPLFMTNLRRLASTRNHSGDDDVVKLVEVGPRDGLQNETTSVATSNKLELIQRLAKAGCSSIEATSFVSPRAIPALADHSEVTRSLESLFGPKTLDSRSEKYKERPHFSVLVPNIKYFNKAMEAGGIVDEIAIFGSSTEGFSQKNIQCSIAESQDRFRDVIARARELNLPVRGYLSCVLGCPYEGEVPPSQVATRVEQLLDIGCYEVSLGDTIGVGTPGSTRTMLKTILSGAVLPAQLAVHFHDTYGQALANILASLDHDVRVIDSSVAGLGGCPYAGGGATGNVATEDVVYMLNGLGMKTGVNLDKLVDAGNFICKVLGKTTNSNAAIAVTAKRGRDSYCK